MPPLLIPHVDPAVRHLCPDFHGLSLNVDGFVATGDCASLVDALLARGAPSWAEAHFEAWRDAFRAFGAKPKKTPSSAEALTSRFVRDGALVRINPLVDLYNAVSIAFAVPLGGEDRQRYQGQPRLIRARGDEVFDTMAAGAAVTEHPDPGEVVWCDDQGVTCRRWNWRQGVRTRITDDSSALWFVIEALGPMGEADLTAAAAALIEGLAQLSPDAKVSVTPLP